MKIILDIEYRTIYTHPPNLAEGRLPETFGGWRRGGACGRGS
jgi:hypothetical protein